MSTENFHRYTTIRSGQLENLAGIAADLLAQLLYIAIADEEHWASLCDDLAEIRQRLLVLAGKLIPRDRDAVPPVWHEMSSGCIKADMVGRIGLALRDVVDAVYDARAGEGVRRGGPQISQMAQRDVLPRRERREGTNRQAPSRDEAGRQDGPSEVKRG